MVRFKKKKTYLAPTENVRIFRCFCGRHISIWNSLITMTLYALHLNYSNRVSFTDFNKRLTDIIINSGWSKRFSWFWNSRRYDQFPIFKTVNCSAIIQTLSNEYNTTLMITVLAERTEILIGIIIYNKITVWQKLLSISGREKVGG